MNPEEYEKMYAQENTYWWFQGRKNILFKMLKRYHLLADGKARVLDIGCGTGLILEGIEGGAFAVGLDFSKKALSCCRRRRINNLVCADVEHLPIADSSVDLVLALDLLEHIEDDNALLREIVRILRPGGYLLATVPAHQSLWSEHDEALHHFRRYSKKGFLRLVSKSGLTPLKYSYVITFTYLPIVLFRLGQKLFRFLVHSNNKPKTHIILLPRLINSFLIFILNLEGFLLERMNLPSGVSLLCIARKA